MSRLINDLAKLHLQIHDLRKGKRSDPMFENWEAKTSRTIKKIFGEDSHESQDFSAISFWYHYGGFSFEKVTQDTYENKNFQTGLDKAELLLEDLIEDAKNLPTEIVEIPKSFGNEKKVFISHSSQDDKIGKEVITMLQLIGVKPNQIFYTSASGYGVPLGKDWVETLKSEVSSEGVVLSLLSENYFNSQICLLEMGATWVLSKLHIPILIPPLRFRDTNDVINSTQGFQILDKPRWSSLKRELEKLLDLEPLDGDKWEPHRDSILDRIEQLLSAT